MLLLSAGAVLDYGCGAKATLLQQLKDKAPPGTLLVGADPCISTPAPDTYVLQQQQQQQPVSPQQQQRCGGVTLTPDCRWAAEGAGAVTGGFDVVVCSLVLCAIAERAEYLTVLDNLATAAKPGPCSTSCTMAVYVTHAGLLVQAPFELVAWCAKRPCYCQGRSSMHMPAALFELAC
jgi:hypothetical protein